MKLKARIIDSLNVLSVSGATREIKWELCDPRNFLRLARVIERKRWYACPCARSLHSAHLLFMPHAMGGLHVSSTWHSVLIFAPQVSTMLKCGRSVLPQALRKVWPRSPTHS